MSFTNEQFQEARAGIKDNMGMNEYIKFCQLNSELIQAAIEIAANNPCQAALEMLLDAGYLDDIYEPTRQACLSAISGTQTVDIDFNGGRDE